MDNVALLALVFLRLHPFDELGVKQGNNSALMFGVLNYRLNPEVGFVQLYLEYLGRILIIILIAGLQINMSKSSD